MYEYAITAGEGTLIAYGCAPIDQFEKLTEQVAEHTDPDKLMVSFALSPDDCETGK